MIYVGIAVVPCERCNWPLVSHFVSKQIIPSATSKLGMSRWIYGVFSAIGVAVVLAKKPSNE